MLAREKVWHGDDGFDRVTHIPLSGGMKPITPAQIIAGSAKLTGLEYDAIGGYMTIAELQEKVAKGKADKKA